MPKWKGNVSHAVQLYVQVHNRLVPWLILLLWAPMHSLAIKVFLLSLSLKHLAGPIYTVSNKKLCMGLWTRLVPVFALANFIVKAVLCSTHLTCHKLQFPASQVHTTAHYYFLPCPTPCVHTHTYTWNTLDTNTEWHPVKKSKDGLSWFNLLVSRPDTVV